MQRINQLQAAITGDGHGKLEDLSPPLLGQCLKMKTHFPHIYACIYYIYIYSLVCSGQRFYADTAGDGETVRYAPGNVPVGWLAVL